MWNNNLRSSLRLEVPLEHPLVRRALEHAVDRVVVADRRRDGLGPVDHDLGRGHAVHYFWVMHVHRAQTGLELTPKETP